MWEIHAIPSQGGKSVLLAGGPSTNTAPAWSRDGKWVYFTSNRTGRREIWKVPVTGGTALPVTRTGAFRAAESLDGSHLFFGGNDGAEIHRMRVSGGDAVLVSNAAMKGGSFVPAKNGIYFIEDRKGDAVLQFLSSDGKPRTLISLGHREYQGLSLSPEGKAILLSQVDMGEADLMFVEGFRY